MQHAEFRRLFGANPKRIEPAVLEHRASCAECAKYAADMRRIDQMVLGALDVPAPKPARTLGSRGVASPPARWYALAASVLVVIAAGATCGLGQRRDALIVEVVKHADRERDVLIVSDKRVERGKSATHDGQGRRATWRTLPFSIARTCKIRGIVAPHLVMQTSDGAVAILLLSKERC